MTDALFLAPVGGVVPGDIVLVDGVEAHHAVAVRRIKPGEVVFVADGQGSAIRGEVLSADKAGLRVRADELLYDQVRGPHVVAVQALAKAGRDEQAIEAMTELGVKEIVPWRAARSIVKWEAGPRGDKQLAKWRSTVREATKQSRRFTIPVVAEALTTAELCRDVVPHATTYVLHEEATDPLACKEIPATGRVLLIIGPEGGIAPDELEAFVAAGAQVVSVAPHVLRSSTAGVVALAQLQAVLARGSHE